MSRVLILILATALLSGCGVEKRGGQFSATSEEAQQSSPKDIGEVIDTPVYIWTDPETTCQYLVFPGVAVTPRINHNGNPVCGRVVM